MTNHMDKIGIGFIGVITAVLGGWNMTLQVLFILIGADIATGVLKALKSGQYTSKDFRQGMVAKAGFIVILILCYQMDVLVNGGNPVFRSACSIFYIGVEGSSILENLGEMGVPVPNFIKDRLKKLKDMGDTSDPNAEAVLKETVEEVKDVAEKLEK